MSKGRMEGLILIGTNQARSTLGGLVCGGGVDEKPDTIAGTEPLKVPDPLIFYLSRALRSDRGDPARGDRHAQVQTVEKRSIAMQESYGISSRQALEPPDAVRNNPADREH
jgi:hypothetical protein